MDILLYLAIFLIGFGLGGLTGVALTTTRPKRKNNTRRKTNANNRSRQ